MHYTVTTSAEVAGVYGNAFNLTTGEVLGLFGYEPGGEGGR